MLAARRKPARSPRRRLRRHRAVRGPAKEAHRPGGAALMLGDRVVAQMVKPAFARPMAAWSRQGRSMATISDSPAPARGLVSATAPSPPNQQAFQHLTTGNILAGGRYGGSCSAPWSMGSSTATPAATPLSTPLQHGRQPRPRPASPPSVSAHRAAKRLYQIDAGLQATGPQVIEAR